MVRNTPLCLNSKASKVLQWCMIITILVFAGVHLVATFESALMDPSNIDWTLIGNDMLTFPVYISGAYKFV